MASNDKDILIAGGGIAGFATALALSQRGFRVRLFEQAPEFAEIGAGIQLGPNVFKMFEHLGLSETVKALAVFPENLIMMDSVTAEEVTRIPVGDPAFAARFGQPYAVIHRADLHRALVDACAGSPLISLHKGTKIASYQDTGHSVICRSASGESWEGAALIGCDGLWSTVRAQLLDDGAPRISGHIAYRAVLPTERMPEELRWQSMTVWAGEKTHLVHYPLRGGELFNLVAVFHSERFTEGWDAYGDVDELHERFAGTCDQVRSLLSRIENWRMWVLCDREPVKVWSGGRVTLLGDAAHPMLQYLAQGANMAIEDAVCVADRMLKCGGDYEKAFADYQQIRYLRTGKTQTVARIYGEVFHASGVVRELRNNMLAGRTPDAAFDSMAWLYDIPQPEPLAPLQVAG